MPLIIPANSLASGGYAVDNSCRFNSGSSDYLVRTMDSAPTLATKATISYWFKRTKLDAWGGMGGYSASSGAGTNNFQIGFNNANYGYFWQNSPALYFYTSAVNRDPSAWKNVVISIDTTQGTASNRVKYYENGIRTTSFVTETYPSQNDALNINKNGNLFSVGRFTNTGGIQYYYDGYFSEVALVDGLALAPTDFGEFDADSGIWKPIDVSGLTFGNNGFYLDFKDSANLGNDANGGTDFTVNNITAIDQTTDTPTLNYATLNSLINFGSGTFEEGNLKTTGSDDTISTIGVTSGKWYWEAQRTNTSNQAHFGIGCSNGFYSATSILSDGDRIYTRGDASFSSASNIGAISSIGSNGGTSATFTTGDILGFYLDLDSGTKNLIVKKNDGGTPLVDVDFSYDGSLPVFVFSRMNSGVGASFNFGNPINTISSSNADANGYGSFEYNPTIGGVDYLSLNTKNLSEVLS